MFIDKTIYHSRPSDKRTLKEEHCYDLLERVGVMFERIDHEPIATIEGCEELVGLLGIHICKNLFLTNSKRDKYYMLILPGHKQLVTRELAREIGSTRLSFGSPEKMEEFLCLTPGSVSVLGLMNDTGGNVELLVDSDITKDEYFGCHPCINTTSLRIKTVDLFEKLLPALGHEPHFVKI